MFSRPFPTKPFLLASALFFATSCADRMPPPAPLTPPADLLSHPDRPALTMDAADSEAAWENWRGDVDDWGQGNADIIDRACRWFRDAGIALSCRPPATP